MSELIKKYQDEFMYFTWGNKTVGAYQKFFNKLIVKYDKDIKKEIYKDIKYLLK